MSSDDGLYQFGQQLYTDNPRNIPFGNQTANILDSYNPPQDLNLLMLKGDRPAQYAPIPGIMDGSSRTSNIMMSPAQSQIGGFAGARLYKDQPTIAIFDNYSHAMKNPDEYKFMIAHELNHIKQGHSMAGDAQRDYLSSDPNLASGTTFMPWTEKRREREADLKGQQDYLNAGYNPGLFNPEKNPLSSLKGDTRSTLSPLDTHPNPDERNAYLKQGFMQWLTEKDNAQKMKDYMNMLKKG